MRKLVCNQSHDESYGFERFLANTSYSGAFNKQMLYEYICTIRGTRTIRGYLYETSYEYTCTSRRTSSVRVDAYNLPTSPRLVFV